MTWIDNKDTPLLANRDKDCDDDYWKAEALEANWPDKIEYITSHRMVDDNHQPPWLS
jgi:hypothetical protein